MIKPVNVITKKLEAHPYSTKLPMMDDEEFEVHKADIQKHGQRNTIKLFEGKILDGRNRYKACCDLGIEPLLEEFNRTSSEALDFVISENLHRRHLTISQKAVASISLYDQLSFINRSEASKRMHAGTEQDIDFQSWEVKKHRSTSVKIGKIFGIGAATVEKAITVRNRNPELLKQVMLKSITVNKAYSMCRNPESRKKHVTQESKDPLARSILRSFNGVDLKMPTMMDSYDFFINYLRDLSEDKNIQIVISDRRIYTQIVPTIKNFKTWINEKYDNCFKRSILLTANKNLLS